MLKNADFNKISLWQLDQSNSNVKLPSMQRGFVWKPSQIESLWDSILRGFPIGSFLLSEAGKEFLLLDGQQRATSIAIGYYNPWDIEALKQYKFWSLNNIPILWIDLLPQNKEISNRQIFLLRVVTPSHPWGYQRINNSATLSVSDRRKAFEIFKDITNDYVSNYSQLPLEKVFPYDSELPVPLSFLIESVIKHKNNWKEALLNLCKSHLSDKIRTKDFTDTNKGYFNFLKETLYSNDFNGDIFSNSIENNFSTEIPGIIIKEGTLKTENMGSDEEDPTLFVRLNSQGTRIAGEELIYSIYKASFPSAKDLVEKIGADFVPPSLVITLISRLVWSEINDGNYPAQLNVTDFTKRIKEDNFKNKLKELIGDDNKSLAKSLFEKAFQILGSPEHINMPPVLVKTVVKSSPELVLMLLHWLKNNDKPLEKNQETKILACVTALSWFGTKNKDYVREIWSHTVSDKFWSKEVLSIPFYKKKGYIMYPLIAPKELQAFLIAEVVKKRTPWDELYPGTRSNISKTYKASLDIIGLKEDNGVATAVGEMWDNFIQRLFDCKSMILFAQRHYINKSFGAFNQMDDLEDTNTPWDWDHIYPSSWIYYKKNVNRNIKHWNRSIGNLRALSLEENRGEGDSLSPFIRLEDVREKSFISKSDWKYWKKIQDRITDKNDDMIDIHLNAVIIRMCNIYKEWYNSLKVEELF